MSVFCWVSWSLGAGLRPHSSSLAVDLSGTYPQGGPCGYNFALSPDPATNWSYAGQSGDLGQGCRVTRECATLTIPDSLAPDHVLPARQCAAVDLGVPPDTSGAAGVCPYGHPVGKPYVGIVWTNQQAGGGYVRKQLELKMTWANLASNSSFAVQVITKRSAGPPPTYNVFPGAEWEPSLTTGSVYDLFTDQIIYGTPQPGDTDPQRESGVVGVQVRLNNPRGTPDTAGTMPYATNQMTTAQIRQNFFENGSVDGGRPAAEWRGRTDPDNCVWWFGDDIRSVYNAQDGFSKPMGGISTPSSPPEGSLPPPTVPTDPTCGTFSWTDMSTWPGAGLCAVIAVLIGIHSVLLGVSDAVGQVPGLLLEVIDKLGNLNGPSSGCSGFWCLLKTLLEGLLDAIGGIAGAITDFLTGALTIHPDSWGVADLNSQVQGRAPFSLLTGSWGAVGTMSAAFSSSGGCSGMAADFTPSRFGSGKLGPKCGDFSGSGAGAGLYALVSWGLIGTAVLYVYRLLAAAVNA
jgi:hypothetical protein